MTTTMKLQPRRRRAACALVLAALAASFIEGDVSVAGSAAPRQPQTHTVIIEGAAFSPASLTIAAGDTVQWLNKDPYPHTATSTGKGFDSGNIPADKSWKVTLEKRGEFPYVCSLHVTMKGVVKVE
jgi:plastocyanin